MNNALPLDVELLTSAKKKTLILFPTVVLVGFLIVG